MKASMFRILTAPLTWLAIVGVLGAELALVAGLYTIERARLRAIERDVTYGTKNSPKHFWRFEMSGLRIPPVLPAATSKIADRDEVIGVVVNGKPRAYWLKALKYPPWHIVNDMVADVPVSVTYCDRTNCIQVYTDRQGSAPLDVNLGGLYGKEMIVKIGPVLYYQASGKPFDPAVSTPALPYADQPWERTTWRDWKQRHPETDVFIGLGGPGPKP